MADVHLTPACTPFPPPDAADRFDPRWRTETVQLLARGIAVHTAYDRLPVLADALEEAGCDLAPLLAHCRYCPTHLPGCWAVDLTLGRPQPVHPLAGLAADPALQAAFRRIVEEPVGPASRRVYNPPPPPPPDWFALRVLLGGAAVALVASFWISRTEQQGEIAPPQTSETLTTSAEEVESVKRVGETLRQLREGFPAGPVTAAEP